MSTLPGEVQGFAVRVPWPWSGRGFHRGTPG